MAPVAFNTGDNTDFIVSLSPQYNPSKLIKRPVMNTRMFISSGMSFSAKSCTALRPAVALSLVFHCAEAMNIVTVSGAAKVLKRSDVTTPMELPAPRMAQKMSGFSVSETSTMVELARTTVAPVTQSRVRPFVCELTP